jgi:arylsulfatase A-like enzyme
MDKLRAMGLDKNTLVIFTSDNGGDPPQGVFRNESNFPLRGFKRDLYEGGIRVPFIAYWAGTIQGGSVTDHASAFWDFMPTACELAGINPPAQTDGISYLPALLGKTQPQHEYLYFEFHELTGAQSVIKGDWKCIRLDAKNPAKARFELYNLKDDLRETTDLSTQNPEVLKELIGIMSTARTENKVFKF